LNNAGITLRNENGLNNLNITKIRDGSFNSPHLQMGVFEVKKIGFSYNINL
jgi:hypothetical protein